MKKEAAEFIVRASLKATSDITVLIPFVREHAENDEEYERYRKAMTAIVRMASEQIFSPLFTEHPEIDKEIENILSKFGRLP